MRTSALATVKKALQVYADKDRAAIDAVVAGDYHFTSPIDNRLAFRRAGATFALIGKRSKSNDQEHDLSLV